MVSEISSAEETLRQLRQDNPDITAAVVVTADGFAIAADAGPDVEADMLAALAADLMARASRSAREFGQGDIQELYARAETGYVVVARAGSDQVLACLASPDVTLGLLLADVRQTAAALTGSV